MFAHIADLEKYHIHIHFESKNASFFHMSKLLQDKGIKNNKFMLALAQKDLAKIEPHKLSDPSQEIVQMIMFECKINPWYFLREIVRVQSQGGAFKPYTLHRGNMAQAWCFYQNIDTYSMLPRQHYKTVSTQCIIAQLMYFRTINFPMTMFTKSSGLVSQNVKRLREIRDCLPEYLLSKSTKDKDNDAEVTYTKLNNRYLGICAQNDAIAADKVARGDSNACQQYDELDFIKYIETMYPSAKSATNEARINAAANNAPYAQLITSTPGFLDSDSGKFGNEMRTEAMLFTDSLYDCGSTEKLKEILAKTSKNRLMLICYSFLQLGKTKKWLEETIASERASPAKVLQDYYLIPTNGSGETGIPSVYLERLRDNQEEPVFEEMTSEGYKLYWHISREFRDSATFKNKKYIFSLDTSTATGSDYISGCIVDPDDLSVVMVMRFNEINLMEFVIFTADFMVKYDNLIFIPENKTIAQVIIDNLILELKKRGVNVFKRIYSDIVQNLNDSKYKHINIDRDDPTDSYIRKHFGYVTAGSGQNSRQRLFADVLFTALEQNAARVKSIYLVNEFCNLTFKGGKLEHSSNSHDDLVFAYLLAAFMVYRGKNLHIYGINSVLSKVDNKGNKLDYAVKDKYNNITKRIQDLEETLKKTENIIIQESCKRELRNLNNLLTNGEFKTLNKPQTVDALQPKQNVADTKSLSNFSRVINNIMSR